jgi:arginine/lysine/ornithine decarboxylase
MHVKTDRPFVMNIYIWIENKRILSIVCILAISAGKKRYKTANLKKIRRHYNQDTLREHIIPDESNRFRYFYHIRRANGDALSSVS